MLIFSVEVVPILQIRLQILKLYGLSHFMIAKVVDMIVERCNNAFKGLVNVQLALANPK